MRTTDLVAAEEELSGIIHLSGPSSLVRTPRKSRWIGIPLFPLATLASRAHFFIRSTDRTKNQGQPPPPTPPSQKRLSFRRIYPSVLPHLLPRNTPNDASSKDDIKDVIAADVFARVVSVKVPRFARGEFLQDCRLALLFCPPLSPIECRNPHHSLPRNVSIL